MLLEAAGAHFAINAGGDIVVRGEAARLSLAGRHPPPRQADRVAAVLALRDRTPPRRLRARPRGRSARRSTGGRVVEHDRRRSVADMG
jgi:hypothetical protein